MIRLCPNVSSAFAEALDKASLFSAKKDMERLRDTLEPREQPQYGKPGESCKYNLFFGFFFDGTRNNYMACEPSDPQAAATKHKEKEERKSPNCHSNVARLYDIYPGQSVPGVLAPDTDWAYKPELYKHFFKVYVPGVGTEFKQTPARACSTARWVRRPPTMAAPVWCGDWSRPSTTCIASSSRGPC